MEPLPAPPDLSLTAFLRAARELSASDLRLATGAIPHARVEGVLRRFALPPLTAEEVDPLVATVLHLSGAAFDRDLDVCIDTNALGRFRVSLHRGRAGVALTLKCVQLEITDLVDLGLPETLDDLTRIRSGLVLVVGPANSGKSTTLAALLDRINRTRREHVVTIEEPIEYVFTSELASITQRQVGRDTASFAGALRSALREDPDVILVSELRDLDTIRTAIVAAETGHLVLGTLHTRDAASTISRILDVFPPRDQQQVRAMLAGSLRAVVCQRLLPRLGGGRRVVAYEVLRVTPAVSTQIRDDRLSQVSSALQTGRKYGMIDLDARLAEMVREGLIEQSVARSAAKDPARFGGGA